MGNTQPQQIQKIKHKKPQPDIEFKIRKSKNDLHFNKIENTTNFFKYMNISDYLDCLLNFGLMDKEKRLNKSHSNEMKLTVFTVFLECKILQNILVFSESGRNEVNYNYFKNFYINVFEFMYKSYKSFYKTINDEKLRQEEKSIPKLGLIPLGIFNCIGSNRSKLELVFNLCANEDYELETESKDLKLLVFFLLMIPSGIYLLTLNETAKEDDREREVFPEDEFIRIYDVYQVKDCLRGIEIVLEKLFKSESKLSYEAFEKNVLEQKLEFIVSASGVRNFLENMTE